MATNDKDFPPLILHEPRLQTASDFLKTNRFADHTSCSAWWKVAMTIFLMGNSDKFPKKCLQVLKKLLKKNIYSYM